MLACHAPSLEQTAIGKRCAKLHAACVLVRRLAAVCAPLETLVSATVQHSRLGRHDRGSDAMLHGGDYAQALMTGFGNHLRSSDVSDEAVFCKTGFETGGRVPCYRPALPHSWWPRHTHRGFSNTLHLVLNLSRSTGPVCTADPSTERPTLEHGDSRLS